MADKHVVRAMDLSKVFGTGETAVRAVDQVSLEVSAGQLVLIMGPSGSGKTTLLSMLGGLLRPTSGRIFLHEIEITALGESRLPRIRAKEIGFIFQAFNLLSSLTVEENVLFPASLVHGKMREARERAPKLLARLGLGRRTHHLPRDLSGGEKQRVAIARALINDPGIILADEPTGNLDTKSGHEVMMVLYDMARDEGRTVVMVTHNPLLMAMADRVVWIEDGKLSDRKGEAHLWVKDPVCGMEVDQWTAIFFVNSGETRHYFCSARCRERFLAVPAAEAQAIPPDSAVPPKGG